MRRWDGLVDGCGTGLVELELETSSPFVDIDEEQEGGLLCGALERAGRIARWVRGRF